MTSAENQVTFDALATELLAEFGITGSFKVNTGGLYDAAVGEVVGGGPVTHAGVLHSPPVPLDERMARDDTLRSSDMVTFIAAAGLTFTPEPGQFLLSFAGATWMILKVEALYSGTAASAYALFITRDLGRVSEATGR